MYYKNDVYFDSKQMIHYFQSVNSTHKECSFDMSKSKKGLIIVVVLYYIFYVCAILVECRHVSVLLLVMICSLKSTQKQRFFPSFVTYSECLLVAILTFSSVCAVLFLRMKESVYSTISLGIKRGKGNKIENHKKIFSK